jgi:hypothetical protein
MKPKETQRRTRGPKMAQKKSKPLQLASLGRRPPKMVGGRLGQVPIVGSAGLDEAASSVLTTFRGPTSTRTAARVRRTLAVDAGRLHPDEGDAVAREPVGESAEPRLCRAKRSCFLVAPTTALRGDPHGRDDRVAVHIKAGAPLDNNVHQTSSSRDDRARRIGGVFRYESRVRGTWSELSRQRDRPCARPEVAPTILPSVWGGTPTFGDVVLASEEERQTTLRCRPSREG